MRISPWFLVLALGAVPAWVQAAGADGGQAKLQAVDSDRLAAEDVRRIQQSLNQQGYASGPVDGIWGARTEGALGNFQQDKGIEATGSLNEETALALGFSASEFARFEAGPTLDENDVRQVQEALNEAGYNAGPVDGKWGDQTRSALRSFQEGKGLDATGELSRETVLALGLSVSEFAAGEFADEGEPSGPSPQ